MSIKQKLFLLTILPTLAILFFSLIHLSDKYKTYLTQKNLLLSSTFINKTAKMLYELQLERGLSNSYLNNNSDSDSDYFTDLLFQQQKDSDVSIKKFNFFVKGLRIKNLNIANQDFIDRMEISLKSLKEIRKIIINKKINASNSFLYFSILNSHLLELMQSVRYYSYDENTQIKILALKKLLIFQEYNAKERGLLLQINNTTISPRNIEKLSNLWELQRSTHSSIKTLLNNSNILKKIDIIDKKESYKYIKNVRKLILESKIKLSLDSKILFKMATKRTNEYHLLEHFIFSQIVLNIQKNIKTMYNSFIYQIIFILIALFSLLFGAKFIAYTIEKSLKSLNNGMDDFFNFLNYKTDNIQNINLIYNDELGDMSKKINYQIIYLQKILKNDKEFIDETTQIVKLMKDGNFSEKSYFKPSNPSLVELKFVFDELIKLISDKIAEQTLSLEKLNRTLENKVHEQTNKLERQIIKITEARDAAVEAELTKDEFLANMSHEIRTPLNAILGFVTILNKHIKNEKFLGYLSIINSSGKSLLGIINDILDFSKIRSGKLTIIPYDIDPIKEFGNAVQLFSSKAYEKNITYAVYIDPNLPKTINIDDIRVKQVLSNLLSNAIKFTPDDGIIKVKIYANNNLLIISVQDNGIGIAANNQKNIFNAFSQADNSTTKRYGGTGLGLSISSLIAKLLDGTLTLISKENIGSIFTLKIPINIIDNSTKKFLNLDKIAQYKFAILGTSKEDEIFVNLIKKYLYNFGITNVISINKFSQNNYDILFFTPNETYNEEIIKTKSIKAIAMVKLDTISSTDCTFATSLHTPFTPLAIVQAINGVTEENIQSISKEEIKSEEVKEVKEVKFIGNILIAEDNKTNQLLISLILDDYDLSYKIAKNGKIAVDMFKNNKFDLVLMDENMPELNGLGAMKQIKEYETEHKLKPTPIVALTANAMITDVKMFLNAGMNGFVAKPIDTDILELELSKFLKKA